MFSLALEDFRQKDRKRITIIFENERVEAFEGESVAAVVLRYDSYFTRRSPVYDSPRAPYCMMGICFECLMVIDGEPNRQACMTQIRDGMHVRRQLQFDSAATKDKAENECL